MEKKVGINMKKFEQFDLFKKKNNVDYHESDPITLNEIVNKHGGINNLRFLEVLTELNDTFKNKKEWRWKQYNIL